MQRNAAAFGGDAGKVTLLGESYGGLSVGAHLVSPGFALMDMPAGAVFPGGPAVEWSGWSSAAEVEALGASVASELGCTDPATAVACLRRVPVKSLFAHAAGFQPYACGNRVLPEVPAQALRSGRFHRAPVLAGATRDEHRLWVGLFRVLAGHPVTAEQYPTLLTEAFGEHADRVQTRYPLSAYGSPNLAWAAVLTDRMWARVTFRQHRLLVAQVPTYAYEFADRHARYTCPPARLPARRLPRRRGAAPYTDPLKSAVTIARPAVASIGSNSQRKVLYSVRMCSAKSAAVYP